MVFFNIEVISATGSARENAELMLASGIIKYENGRFSHIQSEVSAGKTVIERVVKPEPAFVNEPETPAEEIKKEEQEKPAPAVARSEPAKKKPKKG